MSIFAPVLIQVALTLGLQFWMGYQRYIAIRDKTVQWGANKGVKPLWPERAGVVSNAFHNQLEMPMLFYAAVTFALVMNAADAHMAILAWAYALLRLVHAVIHTTYNKVTHRFSVYALSSLVLIAMWVKLGLHAASGA